MSTPLEQYARLSRAGPDAILLTGPIPHWPC